MEWRPITFCLIQYPLLFFVFCFFFPSKWQSRIEESKRVSIRGEWRCGLRHRQSIIGSKWLWCLGWSLWLLTWILYLIKLWTRVRATDLKSHKVINSKISYRKLSANMGFYICSDLLMSLIYRNSCSVVLIFSSKIIWSKLLIHSLKKKMRGRLCFISATIPIVSSTKPLHYISNHIYTSFSFEII